ncbi:MAG TPA: cytochrome b/b6 domain-containing protein [Burkholderiaceae bacterium]|nr:cytochrome b/b6 domain-containing protein [Burkholderiaceae bacterium]
METVMLSNRYTRTAILLHWLIAVVVIVQFGWGWWMQDIPKQPIGPRVDAFNLHKSLGLTILALMCIVYGGAGNTLHPRCRQCRVGKARSRTRIMLRSMRRCL